MAHLQKWKTARAERERENGTACQKPSHRNLTGHLKDFSLCPKDKESHRRVSSKQWHNQICILEASLYILVKIWKNEWWGAKVEGAVANEEAVALIQETGHCSLDVEMENSEEIWEIMKHGIVGFSDLLAIWRETGLYDFQISCLNNWRAICSIHWEKVHREYQFGGEEFCFKYGSFLIYKERC